MLDRSVLRWQFWLLWVAASASGGAVVGLVARSAAYATGYAVGDAAGTVVGETALGVVALGGFLSVIGAAQWLVAFRRIPWAGRFAVATASSGAVAGGVMLGTIVLISPVVGVTLGIVAFWLVQWSILRGRVPWAPWLALAGIAGMVAAAAGGGALGALGQLGAGAGFGGGYGAVTGGALWYLSRRAARGEVDGSATAGWPTDPPSS